ncbi:Ribosomal L38e family protein [Acanthocheilonema viteae]
MPRQVMEMRTFLEALKGTDIKSFKVKKHKNDVRFNLGCSKYLYTLIVKDQRVAEKLGVKLAEILEMKQPK